MNIDLIGHIAGVWCGFACLFYIVQDWRTRWQSYQIEQEIKALYDSHSGYPGYEAALGDVARILEIELE